MIFLGEFTALKTSNQELSRSMCPFRVVNVYSMMTTSNGNIFRVAGPLCREFTGHRWFPSQRPVVRGFDVFFDLRQMFK